MEYRTRFITQNVTPLESLAVKIAYLFFFFLYVVMPLRIKNHTSQYLLQTVVVCCYWYGFHQIPLNFVFYQMIGSWNPMLSVLHIDPSSLCLVGSIFRHLGMTKSNGVEEWDVGTCLKVVEYPRLPSLGLYFATWNSWIWLYLKILAANIRTFLDYSNNL